MILILSNKEWLIVNCISRDHFKLFKVKMLMHLLNLEISHFIYNHKCIIVMTQRMLVSITFPTLPFSLWFLSFRPPSHHQHAGDGSEPASPPGGGQVHHALCVGLLWGVQWGWHAADDWTSWEATGRELRQRSSQELQTIIYHMYSAMTMEPK